MGLTDKQFNGFLRLILSALRDIFAEKDPEKQERKRAELIGNPQTMLED